MPLSNEVSDYDDVNENHHASDHAGSNNDKEGIGFRVADSLYAVIAVKAIDIFQNWSQEIDSRVSMMKNSLKQFKLFAGESLFCLALNESESETTPLLVFYRRNGGNVFKQAVASLNSYRSQKSPQYLP